MALSYAFGACYRIGGDEFVFLGCELSIEQLGLSYPFHLSCGLAIYDAKRDSTLTDTVRRADRLMYRNKRIAKSIASKKESN